MLYAYMFYDQIRNKTYKFVLNCIDDITIYTK